MNSALVMNCGDSSLLTMNKSVPHHPNMNTMTNSLRFPPPVDCPPPNGVLGQFIHQHTPPIRVSDYSGQEPSINAPNIHQYFDPMRVGQSLNDPPNQPSFTTSSGYQMPPPHHAVPAHYPRHLASDYVLASSRDPRFPPSFPGNHKC